MITVSVKIYKYKGLGEFMFNLVRGERGLERFVLNLESRGIIMGRRRCN